MHTLYTQFESIAGANPNTAFLFIDNKQIIQKYSYTDLLDHVMRIKMCLDRFRKENTSVAIISNSNPLLLPIILSTQKANLAFFCIGENMSGREILNLLTKTGTNLVISCNINLSKDFFTLFHEEAIFENTIYIWRVENVKFQLYENISYIIQTSGTTGTSKIVKVFHNCISSNVNSLRKTFDITEKDLIYWGTPVTFDPFIIEIMLALTSGATLVQIHPNVKQNYKILSETLFPKHESFYPGVTVLQIVPSIFLHFPEEDINRIFNCETSLRILALGGERFPEKVFIGKEFSENLKVFNLYGITEVSCWASVERVSEENCRLGRVTLGEPLDHTILELRNKGGHVLDKGEGEIFIGSSSRVCLIDDEDQPTEETVVYRKTGDIGLKNEETQKIQYIGRTDDIIKRFGHRVSLHEIEKTVLNLTNLNSICLWDSVNSKLILFLIIKEKDKIVVNKIIDKLRIKLLRSLPKQSYPDIIETIPSLPVTKHGKVDKNLLLQVSTLNYNLPMQKHPLKIFQYLWTKYFGFGVEEVGFNKHFNFINQGGNSILAVQFVSEYEDLVQYEEPGKLIELLLDSKANYMEYISLITAEYNAGKISNRNLTTERQEGIKPAKIRKISSEVSKTLDLVVKWKYDLEACVDATPVYFEHPNLGSLIAIGSHAQVFYILEANSGRKISQTILQDAIESAAYITQNKGYAIIGCNDSFLYSICIESGEIFWKFQTGSSVKCTPVEYNDNIIFGSYDKCLYCIKIKDATIVWTVNLESSIKSNPVIHKKSHLVYVASIRGSFYCICCKTGTIIWKKDGGAPVFGSPCLISEENLIVWADVKGYILAFNCDTGDKHWSCKAEGSIYSSLTRAGDYLLFGCTDHNIYCLHCTENKCDEISKIDTGAPISSTPNVCVYKKRVYVVVANNRGSISLLNGDNWCLEGAVQLPADVFSSPKTGGDFVFVGCRDNHLYCIVMNPLQANQQKD